MFHETVRHLVQAAVYLAAGGFAKNAGLISVADAHVCSPKYYLWLPSSYPFLIVLKFDRLLVQSTGCMLGCRLA
jgi:hypothetical protein